MSNLNPLLQDKKICSKCNEKIVEVTCKAGDKVFHETCFRCEICHSPLGKNGFEQKDEKMMCHRCYAERMLPRCARCQLPVHQIRLYEVGGRTYHQSCLSCSTCGALIKGGHCWVIGENVYCMDDYFEALLKEEMKKDQQ